MTAKEYVKQYFPDAKAEKHKTGLIRGLQETYYLIRNGRETGYMASAQTESKAWKQVKKYIEENKIKIA